MPKPPTTSVALGLDFGTESVRALLVDLTGQQLGSAVSRYRHGQIIQALPGSGQTLPPEFALQHPADWLAAASKAVRSALRQANVPGQQVVSIGVAFTSCTMLPTLADGTPLCLTDEWASSIWSWPKLWKHHSATAQTDRFNHVARQRREAWLDRYGGVVGLEWFWPKVLETLEHAPQVYQAAQVWLEAGDWLVWQLVGGDAGDLPRSTCQAGYKACWNAVTGYPSADFLAAVHPELGRWANQKLPGRLVAPGTPAGELTSDLATRMGLRPGIPVSAAVIDAHAGVPGAGVAGAGTLVMVLGTSSCHMLNGTHEALIPGVAGVVKDGILPGLYGYETGQAAVGDAFDWLRRLTGARDFKQLDRAAAELPPGAEGVRAVDWLNGCRTPLMDGRLKGALWGLSLGHSSAHLYRALMEASALGLRWIVQLLEEGSVEVNQLVATGGLPHHNPLLIQIYADVLQTPIRIHPSQHGPALGAAILGVVAAGPKVSGFRSMQGAIRTLAGREAGRTVRPRRHAAQQYEQLYRDYRDACDYLQRGNS